MDDKAQLEAMSTMINSAFTKAARDMEGLGKKTKETEGIIGSLKSTLIGPLGLTAVLYGVSKAIESVAEESVQLQALARNTGFAAEGVENIQQAMRRMGQSTQEANQSIATIGSKLQNLGVFKEYSQVWQDLVKFPGGVEFANRLKGLAVAGVQAGDQMAAFNEIIKTFNEQSPQTKIALSQTFGVAISTLEDYSAASKRGIHIWEINAEEAKKYHNIWVDYEVQFNNIFKRVANYGIEAANELTKAFSQQGVTAEGIAEKLNHGIDYAIAGIKHNIEDVKVMVEDFKRIGKFIEDVRTGTALPYPKGEDPMGRDYTRGYKDAGPGRIRLSEDDHTVLENIWKTLQQIAYGTGEGGGVVDGSGGNGGERSGVRFPGGSMKATGKGGFRSGGGDNPDIPGGGGGGGGGKLPSGKRGENAQRLYTELRRLGHSHEQASAALGHAQAESSFNPNTTGDAGTAHGFFQHRGSRWQSLLSKSKEWGLDPSSPEAAARHMDWELKTTETGAGNRYFGAKTVDEAVTALNRYERFAGWQQGQAGRYRAARSFSESMGVNESRARIDHRQSSAGGTFGKINASVEFLNVPGGVKTKASSDGDVFERLNINRTRQAGTYEPAASFNERFSGASPGYE